MNEDVINLCYYFLCKIFALDHLRVEIFTHWPNLASTILKQLARMARYEKKNVSHTACIPLYPGDEKFFFKEVS